MAVGDAVPRPAPRLWSPWILPVAVVAVVMSPMVFTHRVFAWDWFNHLWLVGIQHDSVHRTDLPTYWTHTDTVFYPHFLYYGATLYAGVGYLAALFNGSTIWSYVLCFAGGFGMAYGGFSWLAHQAGLRGWAMHVPGFVYVTAAYTLTNVYARGAWPEFMATAALPLVMAGGCHLLRAPRWSTGAVAAFLLGVVLFTGSHNITLAWGSVFVVVVVLVASLAFGRSVLFGLGTRRLAAVAGLGLLGVALNAWFLMPDIAYSSRIALNATSADYPFFNHLAVIFNPVRTFPAQSGTADLDIQMPVLALAWALIAIGLRWRRLTVPWRRLLIGLVSVWGLFVLLATRDDPFLGPLGRGLWHVLPGFLGYVQFAYRLDAYVALLVAGLVLVALVVAQRFPDRRERWLAVALGAVCLVTLGQAVDQVWSTSIPGDRRTIYSVSPHQYPATWYDHGSFRDASAPVVDTAGAPTLTIDAETAAKGGSSSASVPAGAGPIVTNVVTGTYLVAVPGLQDIGRTPDGRMVVRRKAGEDPTASLRFTVRRAHHLPIVAGQVISLAALVLLLASLAFVFVRGPVRRT